MPVLLLQLKHLLCFFVLPNGSFGLGAVELERVVIKEVILKKEKNRSHFNETSSIPLNYRTTTTPTMTGRAALTLTEFR